MTEEQFPLVIWQKTDEFKKEYEQAKDRFSTVAKRLGDSGFRATYLGDLQFSDDGYPIVWLNSSRTSTTGYSSRDYRMPPTAEEAIRAAKLAGDTGWWTIDALEQLLDGKGPVFERAMFDMGYRRSKTNSNVWAKFSSTKEYKETRAAKIQEVNEAEDALWTPMENEEFKRLNRLWALPNEWVGLNKTYGFKVGQRGFIHVHLQYNPFMASSAEQLPILGEYQRQRGHFAKQQDGFQIEAHNVRLGKERGIQIKANKPDQTYVECVWPTQLPLEKLRDLASDLVARVKK